VSTRDIHTTQAETSCDVCGRTLLRGEQAEMYLDGGARRSVCELCAPRAAWEGWRREGTEPPYDGTSAERDRRRSLLARLRPRLNGSAAVDLGPRRGEELDGRPRRERGRSRRQRGRSPRAPRPEPRQVHAIPTSEEHKISSAADAFNRSEHRRTVAGVARSLGMPTVCVHPEETSASVVNVVVSWELCWYRYEVDLSDDEPSVRVAGQGYELDELAPEELQANAAADEHGSLSLGG